MTHTYAIRETVYGLRILKLVCSSLMPRFLDTVRMKISYRIEVFLGIYNINLDFEVDGKLGDILNCVRVTLMMNTAKEA